MMFLFGAGASIPAGLPGSLQLTQELDKYFAEPKQRDLIRTFRFVVSCIQQHYARTGRSPLNPVNVEEVIELVRFLSEREYDKISTVVSKWHDELERRPSKSEKFKNLFQSHISPLGAQIGREIESKNRDADHAVRDVFDKIADELQSIIDMLDAEDDMIFKDIHEVTLRFVIERISKIDLPKLSYLEDVLTFSEKTSSDIVTLNYDLAVETVCSRKRLKFYDGFDPKTFVYRQTWRTEGDLGINLIKLHGSLDWEEKPVDKATGERIPERDIYFKGRKVDYVNLCKNARPCLNPVLMFAESFKFRPFRFFVDLYSQLFRALDRTQDVVVSGYSFQDPHVNFHLERWLTEDAARRVFIFNRTGFSLPEQLLRTSQYVIKDLGVEGLTVENLKSLRVGLETDTSRGMGRPKKAK